METNVHSTRKGSRFRRQFSVFQEETRMALIFFMLLLVCLVMEDSVHAYYSPYPDREVETVFTNRTKTVESRKPVHFLVLYDNIDCPVEISSSEAILFGHSVHFVPADLIDFNLAIYPLFHNKLKPGRALDNLVYANMKINLLIEDYRQLQDRSRALLEDLGIPYLEEFSRKELEIKRLAGTDIGPKKSIKEKNTPNEIFPEKTEQEQTDPKKNEIKEKRVPSVSDTLKALNRQARGTMAGKLKQEEVDEEDTQIRSGLEGGYVAVLSNSGRKNGGFHSTGPGTLYGPNETVRKSGAGRSFGGGNTDVGGIKPHRRRLALDTGTEDVHWILRISRDVTSYMTKHPIQALICLLLVYLLISLMVRR